MTNDTTTTSAPLPTTAPGEQPDLRELLARSLSTSRAVLLAVRPDQMGLPTPCGDFDVRRLVAHLLAVADRIAMLGTTGTVGTVGPEAELEGDAVPLARWDRGAQAALEAWADDATLDARCEVPWAVLDGRSTLAIYINELTVHTWDLARATGQRPEWDADVVAISTTAIHDQLPDGSRTAMWAEYARQLPAGAPFSPPFADAIAVDPTAPAIDHLVGWNGRQP